MKNWLKIKAGSRWVILPWLCAIVYPASGTAATPVDKTLEAYLKVFPETKSIGVIYSQASFEPSLKQLEAGAKAHNVKVVKVNCPGIKEFPAAITGIKDQVDTVWVPDDPLFALPDVWSFFLFFTIRNQLKTVVSTEKALKEGGLFYYSENKEAIINKRMLDIFGIKVSSLGGAVRFYEPSQ